jgi:hypothetical protein
MCGIVAKRKRRRPARKSLEDAAFHVCGSANMAKRASECIKMSSSILVRVTAEDLRSTT